MMFLVTTRLALRSLGRNKLRAALTVIGILIGVAAVVTVTALGAGAKDRMEQQMASLGVNLLMVMPGATATTGARGAAGSASGLTEDDARAVGREINAVGAVAPTLGAGAQIVYGARNWSSRVTGTTPDYLRVRNWPMALGSFFTDADVRTKARVCVLGETVRQNLFGGDDPVGSQIRIGRAPCTVVGVLVAKGQSSFGQDQDDTVLVPLSTFRSRVVSRPGTTIGMMMVSASDARLVSRAEREINSLLRQRHRLAANQEPDFTVRNLAELTQSFDAQRQALTILLLAVASISLLVGGIGVMNIMLVSVTERTREIGIRLAIGARSADIMGQFLVEAVALAIVGGIAGLGLGIGVSKLVGRLTEWSVTIQPSSAVLAMAVSGGIGVVFGFFPARRASQLDPIVALKHE